MIKIDSILNVGKTVAKNLSSVTTLPSLAKVAVGLALKNALGHDRSADTLSNIFQRYFFVNTLFLFYFLLLG